MVEDFPDGVSPHYANSLNMSEEKKISLEELEDLLEEAQDGPSKNGWFSLPNLFALLVLNWQWFLLSFFICASAAVLYLRYASPVYQVSGRMLVKDEKKQRNPSELLNNVQDLGFLSNSTGIDNEMEVLQSRVLLRDAVMDLKLYAEYKREEPVKNVLVYGKQPISVDLDPLHLDSLDKMLLEEKRQIRLHLSREGKRIAVEGTLEKDKEEVSVFNCKLDSMPAT